MRRSILIFTLCLLLGLLIWWWPPRASSPARTEATATPRSNAIQTTDPAFTVPPVLSPPPPTSSEVPAPPSALSSPPSPNPRLKRAYVLRFDQGALTLVTQENIEGDFAPPRRPPEAWSGMLRLRLLAADGSVLAEEISSAPDQLCTVLDAHAGPGQPVDYVVPGPVVFQVRLPRADTAVRLDISRITQPEDPARDTALGSLPLATL